MGKKFKVDIERSDSVEVLLAANDARDAVARALETYHGWDVVSVDNVVVMGLCESCSQPVLETDDFVADGEDGGVICLECAHAMAREDRGDGE